MPEENKALIRQYFTALSGRDKSDSIVNIFVKDEQLKQQIKLLEKAFPRYQMIIEDMLAEADRVVVRVTIRGIHKGEFLGIAPTSKKVTITGILIYQIINGKIVDHWMYFDTKGLMQQLRSILKNQKNLNLN